MNYDNEFINRYRDAAERLDCMAFYQFARNDGVSRAHAAFLLRDLFNCNLDDCLRIMRDCGDDPKQRASDNSTSS